MRLTCVLCLFASACLLAGCYGALHNQISFTVSPEYFTKFKFAQFQIDPKLPERVGAAYVGWQASWWMGIVIGVFIIPLGLIIRNTHAYVHAVLRAFVMVLITAIAFGLVGLAIAFVTISADNGGTLVSYNQSIADPAAFRRAGMMHNCSYLGGLIGIFVGATSILRSFLKSEIGSAKIW